MKPVHVLVSVLALALAGGAWFLVQDSGAERATAAPSVADPRAPSARPSVEVAAPGGTTPETRSSAELEPAPSETLPQATIDALAGVTPKPFLHGRVVDAHGAAVVGASVLAAANRRRVEFALDSSAFQERYGRHLTRTETGEDGRFTLQGPAPGRVRIAVRAAGFAPYDNDDLDVPADEEFDLGTIALQPGVRLAGRVLGPDARPVSGAQVLSVPLVRDFGIARTAREIAAPVDTTAADGGFRVDRLAPGPWKLLVRTDDYPDHVVEGVIESGRPSAEVEVRLEPGLTLSGEVIGERDGALVVRATPAGVQRVAAGGSSPEYREAPVDGAGRFELRGLSDAWPYLVRVRAAVDTRGQPRWLAPPVDASAGQRGIRIELSAGADLLFSVLDGATGKPIADFAVTVIARLGERTWKRHLDGGDDDFDHDPSTGWVRLRSLQAVGADGRTAIQVRASGYTIEGREDLRLNPGSELDLGVLSLTPLPTTRARVVSAATGEPVQHALVHLTTLDEPAEEGDVSRIPVRTSASTDAAGIAFVAGPAGRRVFLWATHPSYAPCEPTSLVVPFAGQPEVELRLTEGGSIEVLVRDDNRRPLVGRTVQRQEFRPEVQGGSWQAAGGTGKLVTDGEGLALFEHLRPGRHRFAIAPPAGRRGMDRSWTETTVAEGEHRTLEIGAPALFRLRGRVAEAGFPLAGARVWLHSGHERSHRRALLGARRLDPASRTGSDGAYEIADVETGDYLLIVQHPTRSMDTEIPMTFEQQATYEYDVDLPITRVSGTVTGPGGQPLRNIDISILRERDARRLKTQAITLDGDDGEAVTTTTAELERAVRTDASGHYEMRGVVPETNLVVVARANNVQTVKSGVFQVEVDGVRDGVDLVVEPAGSLRVSVLDAEGAAAPNVSVHAHPRGRGSASGEVHHEVTGSEGEVVLLGLRPGTWRVRVAPRVGGGIDDEPLPYQEVQVLPRERASLLFQLPE